MRLRSLTPPLPLVILFSIFTDPTAMGARNPNVLSAALELATGLLGENGVTVSSLFVEQGRGGRDYLVVTFVPGDATVYRSEILELSPDPGSLAHSIVAIVAQIRCEHPPKATVIELEPLLLRCTTHPVKNLYDESEG